jgi:hypothetical protein
MYGNTRVPRKSTRERAAGEEKGRKWRMDGGEVGGGSLRVGISTE